MISLSLIKLFLPVLITFIIGMAITPVLTTWMYKNKLWKRAPRKNGAEHHIDEKGKMHPDAISLEFQKITNEQEEIRTPRVGGMVVWLSVLITSAFVFLVFFLFPNELTAKLEFVSKNQTLLPFMALIVGSIVGLIDDLLCIKASPGTFVNGLPRNHMILIMIGLGLIFGLWFFTKLDITSLSIPFSDWRIEFGWLIVPIFILVTLGTFSSGVIDGIDGLAGGVMGIAFASFGVIAYLKDFIDIAALCFVIAGGILAFLWFNIPPARFYMGETGMLGLTLALAIVAFMTNSVFILPIVGILLVVTSLSSFIQILSKKYFGKKVFRVAPLHHHFESLGWSREKITMRYWVISLMAAAVGIIISLVG